MKDMKTSTTDWSWMLKNMKRLHKRRASIDSPEISKRSSARHGIDTRKLFRIGKTYRQGEQERYEEYKNQKEIDKRKDQRMAERNPFPGQIEFNNRYEDLALIRVVGGDIKEIPVSPFGRNSVSLLPGRYTVRVRYGKAGNYEYYEGGSFSMEDTKTTRTSKGVQYEIPHKVLTLYKSGDGIDAASYDLKPITPEQFYTGAGER